MTAAVTGASGHLGANLVRALLKRGSRVRALIHHDRRAVEGLDVEAVRGDILDGDSLKRLVDGADTLFHLASAISISERFGGLVERTNVRGTRNVVEACAAGGVKRLIHVSSIQAFAQPAEAETTDERMKLSLNGRSLLYDRTKAEGQRIVLEAVRGGLDAVVVNPTAIIGPNDFKVSRMGRAILNIYRRRYPVLVDGGFDWVDARDVAEGILAAEIRGKSGECYLLSGHWAHLRDVSAAIARITGRKTPRIAIPLWLAEAGSHGNELFCSILRRRANFTPDAVKTLRMSRRISHHKASEELGYEPRSLEVTIRDTLSWFRRHGLLDG